MKKRWLGLLAPLAALPIALGSGAGAATAWRTFGSGIARGPQGWAELSVTSDARKDPVALRITFSDGDFGGQTHIGWIITAYADGTAIRMWNRWGDGDYSLPKTFTWSLPSWVDHAVVNASASTVDSAGTSQPDQLTTSAAGTFHPVRVIMQARY
jgi:hypothetical protein